MLTRRTQARAVAALGEQPRERDRLNRRAADIQPGDDPHKADRVRMGVRHGR
jgi:hypothetical protein